jgi:hypothetical protein
MIRNRAINRGVFELWQWFVIRNARCAVCGAKGGAPCRTGLGRDLGISVHASRAARGLAVCARYERRYAAQARKAEA